MGRTFEMLRAQRSCAEGEWLWVALPLGAMDVRVANIGKSGFLTAFGMTMP
ncbi:MAG: hypothetical protein JSS87_05140 [Acidobacteria bacterium]|nr:hypothetical protein [Acidobacteriota bacterium]